MSKRIEIIVIPILWLAFLSSVVTDVNRHEPNGNKHYRRYRQVDLSNYKSYYNQQSRGIDYNNYNYDSSPSISVQDGQYSNQNQASNFILNSEVSTTKPAADSIYFSYPNQQQSYDYANQFQPNTFPTLPPAFQYSTEPTSPTEQQRIYQSFPAYNNQPSFVDSIPSRLSASIPSGSDTFVPSLYIDENGLFQIRGAYDKGEDSAANQSSKLSSYIAPSQNNKRTDKSPKLFNGFPIFSD